MTRFYLHNIRCFFCLSLNAFRKYCDYVCICWRSYIKPLFEL